MGVSYKVVGLLDAKKAGYPAPTWGWDEDEWYEWYDQGIWRFEDDEPVEFIATSGGEPEDNSFIRDYAWVAPALNAAYELGRASR
jgi:hypothetical protein